MNESTLTAAATSDLSFCLLLSICTFLVISLTYIQHKYNINITLSGLSFCLLIFICTSSVLPASAITYTYMYNTLLSCYTYMCVCARACTVRALSVRCACAECCRSLPALHLSLHCHSRLRLCVSASLVRLGHGDCIDLSLSLSPPPPLSANARLFRHPCVIRQLDTGDAAAVPQVHADLS